MFSTLWVVLPIFALIGAGWGASRIGVLGPHATTELNRFVVYLALPTLLFDIVAHSHGAELWQPGFIAAFGLGSFAIFLATVAIRLRVRRNLADAAIDGLNAGYANTGYMGFPLALAALGPASLVPTTIAAIMTVCVIFGVAIVLIEIGMHKERSRLRLILGVGRSLAKNPLLIAPVLGALVPLSGLTLPAPVEGVLKMLGGTASPCALVALGLFLAQRRGIDKRDIMNCLPLILLKLIAQPVLVWFFAVFVFRLPPFTTHAAVLLSALPTGTGPFMLAEFYRRGADVTSNVILLSTILSIVTVPVYLAIAQ
ncbi:MAG TPA: AEC family transporter [Terriglobia bacterium]|nr:AEC family transporter [Terriglobia bacterium]